MNRIKSIHFVGVKGVGMTPLAIIAKEAGINITGSDVADEFITDIALKKAGITPQIGFVKKNVGDVDLVIATGAHGGFDNAEVLEAKKKGIKVVSQGEAVGIFMEGKIFDRNFTGISITGTHGKTTTSAMIATLLKANDLDPTYLIGTAGAASLGAPGHFGKGEFFVAEADEYMTEPNYDKTIKHMWQHPKIAVITSIEYDHPDVYNSIDDVRGKFLAFANQLPEDGVLVACGDDPQLKKLLLDFKGSKITYGIGSENNFVVDNLFYGVKFPFFGSHNLLNAAAAYAVGSKIGLSKEQIVNGLMHFTGSKRRSEFIGKILGGARLFDDYAHHPTEIQKALKAFRDKYPKKRLICIFQPHTYSRTKSLFEQFSISFNNVDVVILTNVYSSMREKIDLSFSMQSLANKIGKKAIFLPDLQDVVKYIKAQGYGKNDIVITMGAGDVYKIGTELGIKF